MTRWVEALVAIDQAGDALAAMARRTEDPVRDLAPVTLATVRRRLESLPHAGRLLAAFEGEEERDERSLGESSARSCRRGW